MPLVKFEKLIHIVGTQKSQLKTCHFLIPDLYFLQKNAIEMFMTMYLTFKKIPISKKYQTYLTNVKFLRLPF